MEVQAILLSRLSLHDQTGYFSVNCTGEDTFSPPNFVYNI